MSCKTETQEISGVEYACTQYSAIDAMKYKLKVVRVLGGALGAMLPILSREGSDEQQSEALGVALSKLFEAASPDEIVDLVVEMVTTGHTKRDGQRLTRSLFEQVFSGDDLLDAYKVFIFVLKVNFAGFFKGQKAQDLLSKAQTLTQ